MIHFILIFCLAVFPCLGNEMTLEEKVGQLLMVHFHGEEANLEACRMLQEAHVGGIIYYSQTNGLSSPSQVQRLSESLQTMAKETGSCLPLLIAVDQEGGRVAHLKQGFTLFPGNRELGLTGDPSLAESEGWTIGSELKAVGIDMDLAPVVDVLSNPNNMVMKDRIFGETADLVTTFGEKMLLGMHRAALFTSLKHFPGLGDVERDTHEDLPVTYRSLAELEAVEFVPFTKLSSQTDAIMVAHLLVPALDPDHCSSLSAKTIGYLRDTIGFQGVVMTDSLVMKGVLKKCGSVDEAALQALVAGCDILLLGGQLFSEGRVIFELTVDDIVRIHHFLVDAVKNGRIPEQRVDDAVQKIMRLKQRIVDRI